jgi:hypothetical protein
MDIFHPLAGLDWKEVKGSRPVPSLGFEPQCVVSEGKLCVLTDDRLTDDRGLFIFSITEERVLWEAFPILVV